MCKHETFQVVGTPRCFAGPLGDNRAAHGCIEVTERCCECGAERRANRNQHHHEPGPWGPSADERLAVEHRRKAAAIAAEDAAAKASGAEIVDCQPDGRRVALRVLGRAPVWVTTAQLDAAAAEPDDEVSSLYRGLARMAHRHVNDEITRRRLGPIVR